MSCVLLRVSHRGGQAARPRPPACPESPPLKQGLQQKHTHFGDAMMDLRTRSVLSAAQVQQIAEAVYKDGGITEELEHIAFMGKQNQGGNCYRAWTRFAQRRHALCQLEPYKVTVPIDSDKDVGIDSLDVHVMLPHELFSSIFDLYRESFHELLCTADLAKFWADESAHRSVPSDVADDASHTIPVRMYGDDASHCKTNAFIAVYWMSATAFRLPAGLSKFPFCIFPTRNTDAAAREIIFRVYRWSLEAMRLGKHPSRDPFGKALDGARGARAGQPLASTPAGNFRAVQWEFTGDWKFECESFMLPWKYNCTELCLHCEADSSDGPLSYRNMRDDAPHLRRTRADAHYVARHPLLPQLARFADLEICDPLRSALLIDWQHAGPLGIHQKINGSALITLVEEGYFGTYRGAFESRYNACLKKAYRQFCKWCKKRRLRHSHTRFNCSQLSMSSVHDWPMLKAKAHNSTTITKWLHAITRNDRSTAAAESRAACLWSLDRMHEVFVSSDFRLTDKRAALLLRALRVLQRHWSLLASSAAVAGKPRWGMIPKLHKVMHLLRRAAKTRRNPASHWCYGDESNMGTAKKAAALGHKSTTARRVIEVLIQGFALALDKSRRGLDPGWRD